MDQLKNQLNDNERIYYQYKDITIVISTMVDDIEDDKKTLKIAVKNSSFTLVNKYLTKETKK